jgi:hypothetical protein
MREVNAQCVKFTRTGNVDSWNSEEIRTFVFGINHALKTWGSWGIGLLLRIHMPVWREAEPAYLLRGWFTLKCLVKPVDFERFVEISQALKRYWLWLSEAPELLRPATGLSGIERPDAPPSSISNRNPPV